MKQSEMSLVESEFDAVTGIGRLWFNRPQALNALDVPLAREIEASVEAMSRHSGLRCLLLAGRGRAFMAGGDLTRFAEDFERADQVVGQLLDHLIPAILRLRALDAPVIASVQGAAAGAGLSLVSACDIVIASADARFVLAYDRIGAVPDCGGSFFLPRKIGELRTAEMFLLNRALTATEAREWGLVTRVVGRENLEAETDALARAVASGPTASFGRFKQLLAGGRNATLEGQLKAEKHAFEQSTATADFREGVSAFLAKRAPEFRGR